MPKRKKDPNSGDEPKKPRVERPIEAILKKNCPDSYLSKDGKFPRQHKGGYMCQVFSRQKLPGEKQTTRTRTVTCGFDKVVRDDKRDTFGGQINKAVEHLSQERYIASLLANYLFIKALDSCTPGDFDNIPEPNESFFGKCMTSVGARSSSFKEQFTEFSRLTGLKRMDPPRKLPLTQPRTLLARQMATCASTRTEHTVEGRRRAILKYTIAKAIPNAGAVNFKVYNRWKHALAELMLDFDGSESGEHKIRQKAMGMNNVTGASAVLQIAREERTSFGRVLEATRSLSRKLKNDGEDEAKSVSAPTIAHLRNIYNRYVLSDSKQYNHIVKVSYETYPGDGKEDIIKRAGFVRSRWGNHKPPKEIAPLPICSTKAVFISIDTKTLVAWGHECSDDAWWFDQILQPFSKRVNIPCLRSKGNAKYARDINGFLTALKPVKDGGSPKCPWMIGSTFLTDGVQVKLGLHTILRDHPGFSGSEQLDKAGYKLPRAEQTVVDLLEKGRGVYNVKSVTPVTIGEVPGDLKVMSIDPGQVKVVNVVSAPAKVWMERNPVPLLNRCSYVCGEEYRTNTLAKQQEVYEVQRRSSMKEYGDSCRGLQNHKKRTSCMETFLDYCSSWVRYGPAIFKESLRNSRKCARFERFRAVQSQVEKIADRYLPKKLLGKSLLFFGKASFRPQKGKASAPRKKLVRALACRGLVLMVDESGTSANCPGCKTRLCENSSNRTKTCKKFTLGSDENCCLLNSSRLEFEMDRDNCGATSIGLRGFGTIVGHNWF